MNRLFDFFFTNGPLRYKAYKISAVIAFVYAFANIWGLHRKEQNVAPEMTGLLLLSISIFLLWHIFKGEMTSNVPPPKVGRGLAWAGAISLLFVVSLWGINVARMQAYIADAALHHFYLKFESVEAAPLAPEQVQSSVRRIQSIVTASERNKVPVNSDTVQKTGAALSNYLKSNKVPPQVQQSGYSAVLDLQSLWYTREAQSGTFPTLPISSVGRQFSDEGYVINSFLAFDQHDVLITGNHSLLVLGDTIRVSKVTVVFKDVDFLVRGGYPPLMVDQGGRIAVIDSIFQDGVQPLDNISWIDVQFRGTQPEYHGGAIRLRNVTFTGFNRDRLLISLPPALVQLIFDSGGKPINYVLEPVR
jgi:hypothetical protein